MTARDRTMLIVVGLLVVLGGAWFFVVSPKRDEAAQLSTQVTAAQVSLDTANADVARYTAAREQLRSDAKALRAAGKALPTRVAMPALLSQLEGTAKSDGVMMTALTTSGVPNAGTASATPGIDSVKLSLTFDGRFVDLQRYLATLQSFVRVSAKNVDATGRLFELDGVSLGPSGEGLPKLTASVSASVYVLQPDAIQPAAAPATGTAAPAAPATTSSSAGSSPTPPATAEVPR